MLDYLDLLKTNSPVPGDKTKVTLRFDLSGFNIPSITAVNCDPKKAVQELLWLLKGEDTVDGLIAQGINRRNKHVIPGTAIYRELKLVERLHTPEGEPYQASHSPERFFSTEEKPDHEYIEIYNLWRPIGLTEKLHAELDELGVPRQVMVGGDLSRFRVRRWSEVVDIQNPEYIDCNKAFRYLQTSDQLNQLTSEFKEIYGPGSLDLWVLKSGNRQLDPDLEEDRFIIGQLKALGYSPKRPKVVKRIDRFKEVIEQLKATPEEERIITFHWGYEDIIHLQFNTAALTHMELVGVLMRSNLVRKADLELFDSHEPVDRIKYNSLDTNVLKGWMLDNNLPVRGLGVRLQQDVADLYNDFPTEVLIYSLLVKLFAKCTHMEPLYLIWSMDIIHLQENQAQSTPTDHVERETFSELAVMINDAITDLDEFSLSDFTLMGYPSL